ncbi:MAG: hypothetical protein VYA69_02265 [Gemmatimonadota bacterium]|nr:hypothetical protein [Gemmatimonadota bacterium]
MGKEFLTLLQNSLQNRNAFILKMSDHIDEFFLGGVDILRCEFGNVAFVLNSQMPDGVAYPTSHVQHP